jgi:hypothetical protein
LRNLNGSGNKRTGKAGARPRNAPFPPSVRMFINYFAYISRVIKHTHDFQVAVEAANMHCPSTNIHEVIPVIHISIHRNA